jgi:hypothetical protein
VGDGGTGSFLSSDPPDLTFLLTDFPFHYCHAFLLPGMFSDCLFYAGHCKCYIVWCFGSCCLPLKVLADSLALVEPADMVRFITILLRMRSFRFPP